MDWFYIIRGDIFAIGFNDHIAALKDFDHAVQLTPDHYPFRNIRANSNLALGNHAAAIDDLEIALNANPDSPNGRFTLLKSYVKAVDMRGAADTLLAPRPELRDGGALSADLPITLGLQVMTAYRLSWQAEKRGRVTITAESDDAHDVSPFIALIDPNGEVVAHSTIYASFSETPDASASLHTEVAPGTYIVFLSQNFSTWMSVGEGSVRLTLTLDE